MSVVIITFLLAFFISIVISELFTFISKFIYNNYYKPLKTEDAKIAEEESTEFYKDDQSASENNSVKIVSSESKQETCSNTCGSLDYDPPSVNDIIVINKRVNKQPNQIHGINKRVSRCISTYGMIPIDPIEVYYDRKNNSYNYQKYKVVSIDNVIPNCKIDCININYNPAITNNTHIHVVPFDENIDNSQIFKDDNNKEIFWYINYEDMTICQYEDGYPIESLENIFVIGKVDNDNNYVKCNRYSYYDEICDDNNNLDEFNLNNYELYDSDYSDNYTGSNDYTGSDSDSVFSV